MSEHNLMPHALLADNCEDYLPNYHFDAVFGTNGMHCHDFYEIYIHFGGGRQICIDDNLYLLTPNQMIIIPPFRLHGLVGKDVPVNYDRGYLYITSSALKNAGCGKISINPILDSRTNTGDYSYMLSREDAAQCKALLRQMSRLLGGKEPLAQYSAFSKLVSFLDIVLRTVQNTSLKKSPVSLHASMQQVLSYINQNYAKNLRLDEIAKMFGISTSLLSHEFVKFTGRSVYEYVLHCRIRFAKELIYSGTSLGDAAFQCGFNDYSSFLRAFTKIVGMSPGAYRKYSKALKP